jgi:hypothetical protein
MYSQAPVETNVSAMVIASSAVSETEIAGFVDSVAKEFSDGLSWSDLPTLVSLSVQVCQSSRPLVFIEGVISTVISQVIDNVNTPYLPDGITDPILKRLANKMLDYVFGKEDTQVVVNEGQMAVVSDVPPTKEELRQYAVQLQDNFTDGFQVEDVVKLVMQCRQYLSSFSGLTLEVKRACIIEIIDDFIDITDSPYLPDSLFDPLFKMVVPSFVDFVL